MYNPTSTLRTETFLREDIRSLLSALSFANSARPHGFDAEASEHYHAGFEAAVQAVAMAFDVPLPRAREWRTDARSTSIDMDAIPNWQATGKQ